jgi:hypothetical protein
MTARDSRILIREFQSEIRPSLSCSRITIHESQERTIERFWQERGHAIPFDFTLKVGEKNFGVAAEFPQDLATSAARWRERVRVGNDGDGVESALAFRNSLKDRYPLGAR